MKLAVGSVSELGLDSASVCAFYQDNWQRKIALSNRNFYNWQFCRTPAAPGLDNCVVAYDAQAGRLAGVMGLNARPFTLDGETVDGAELTTWIVSPDYQGGGVGPQILSHIQRTYGALIGMGISAMALPIYLRSGFRFMRAIPRFCRVYELDALKEFSTQTALARKLLASWDNGRVQPTYRVSPGFDGADALWERVRTRLNLFSRASAQLRWRYTEHPAFAYHGFTITTADGASAIVCLRQECSVPGLRIAHLLDCYGDDAAIPAALDFVDCYCREHGMHAADFFCTSSAVNRFFLAGGWFSTLDDECFQMPHLFHPVELRNPPTTSLVYWAKDNFAAMCDLSRLYVTKQDADFDRPVL